MASVGSGSCIDAVTHDYVHRIPDVWQIITPMAIDVLYDPMVCSDKPLRAPSFLEPRLYTLRIKCRKNSEAHVYFMGLATDPAEEMTDVGAERIARLLNDQHIVMSIHTCVEKCDAPFSYASLADHLENEYFLKIEGIAYHCHCDNKFSTQCWRSVFAAAEKAASVCKELRATKARLAKKMNT